jgi:RNA-directed DNA polymerase
VQKKDNRAPLFTSGLYALCILNSPVGVPTVLDRVAQTAVVKLLEPRLDPKFDQDSYGYRPKKSAHDAIAKARERCFKFPYVIDLDIKPTFRTKKIHQ